MKKVITLKLALYRILSTGSYFTVNSFGNDDYVLTKKYEGQEFIKFIYIATEVDE